MGTRMRIAQIAPLTEAVPPKLHGGTKRVVSWLTEALVDQGHDVLPFASGGSYGYGFGHRGVGIIGLILIAVVILSVLGRL
jgi:hypothetical protein